MKQADSLPAEDKAAKSGLVDQAIEDIRLYIQNEHLSPGDMLPSETLFSERLGVSRTVAREAFRALSAIGILEVGNGRRARVAIPDAGPLSMVLDHTVHIKQLSIQQIFDVRRTLEIRTASLAALRRSDAEADELYRIVQKMEECWQSPDEMMTYDISFHDVIANASRNPLYVLLIGSFRAATRQTFYVGWQSRASSKSHPDNIRIHREVADAIADHDSTRAEQAMLDHFDSTIQMLVRAGVV